MYKTKVKHVAIAVAIICCILRGRIMIKGFNRSITTIMCEDGSCRTVVG